MDRTVMPSTGTPLRAREMGRARTFGGPVPDSISQFQPQPSPTWVGAFGGRDR